MFGLWHDGVINLRNANAVALVLTAAIESDKFEKDLSTLQDYIDNFMKACRNKYGAIRQYLISEVETVLNAVKTRNINIDIRDYDKQLSDAQTKQKSDRQTIVEKSNDPVGFDPEEVGVIDGNEELRKENEKRQQEIRELFESGEPFGEKKVSEIKTADDFIKYFAKAKKGDFISMLRAMNIGDEISFTRTKFSRKNFLQSIKKFTILKVDYHTFDIEIKMGIIGRNISSFRIYTQWDDDDVLQLASKEPKYDDSSDDEEIILASLEEINWRSATQNYTILPLLSESDSSSDDESSDDDF